MTHDTAELAETVESLLKRVGHLERAVFPEKGPGPSSGLTVKLQHIDERLQSLKDDLTAQTGALDAKYTKKISELIETIAELSKAVSELVPERSVHVGYAGR